jgi:hypothetical protein
MYVGNIKSLLQILAAPIRLAFSLTIGRCMVGFDFSFSRNSILGQEADCHALRHGTCIQRYLGNSTVSFNCVVIVITLQHTNGQPHEFMVQCNIEGKLASAGIFLWLSFFSPPNIFLGKAGLHNEFLKS